MAPLSLILLDEPLGHSHLTGVVGDECWVSDKAMVFAMSDTLIAYHDPQILASPAFSI
jgi:hypothetical protein